MMDDGEKVRKSLSYYQENFSHIWILKRLVNSYIKSVLIFIVLENEDRNCHKTENAQEW